MDVIFWRHAFYWPQNSDSNPQKSFAAMTRSSLSFRWILQSKVPCAKWWVASAIPKVLPFSGIGLRIWRSRSAFLYTANNPQRYLYSEVLASSKRRQFTESHFWKSRRSFSFVQATETGVTLGHSSTGRCRCFGFSKPALINGSLVNLLG